MKLKPELKNELDDEHNEIEKIFREYLDIDEGYQFTEADKIKIQPVIEWMNFNTKFGISIRFRITKDGIFIIGVWAQEESWIVPDIIAEDLHDEFGFDIVSEPEFVEGIEENGRKIDHYVLFVDLNSFNSEKRRITSNKRVSFRTEEIADYY